MKKYIPRILFALLGSFIVLLPLLPKAEAEAEYTYAGEIAFRESYADERLIYLYNKDGIIAELPADSNDGFYIDFSLERGSAVIIPDMDYDTGGTLYHVDTEGADPIATGVYCAFASDNERCAFLTRSGKKDYQLHYFDGNGITCLEPQLAVSLNSPGSSLRLSISPDGKTVAYCRADGDGGITGMLYHKGKYIELGPDIFPIAVSNNLDYLYYGKLSCPASEISEDDRRPTSEYYVRSSGEDVLIGESQYSYFRFNRDFSEALITLDGYSDTDYSYYSSCIICADGGRELKLLGDFYPVGVIAPQAGLAAECSYGYASSYFPEQLRLGINSFRGKVLHGSWGGQAHDVCFGGGCPYHNTAYLSDSFELRMLTGNTYFMQIADEGHAALYKKDEQLYLIPDVRSYTPGSELRISEYCKNFTGNADFSTIYYVNTANNLYSYRDGNRTLLAEDVVFLTPSIQTGALVYRPGITPVRFNGSVYFQKAADDSVWRISSDGNIERLDYIPAGAGTFALGSELLLQFATDEGTDFYRFDDNGIVKVISGMKKYY